VELNNALRTAWILGLGIFCWLDTVNHTVKDFCHAVLRLLTSASEVRLQVGPSLYSRSVGDAQQMS
jgi:hypothetical protein